MIKLKPRQTQAEQICQDLQALDVLISGMNESTENKLATATFTRVIAAQAQSLAKLLNKEAERLQPELRLAVGKSLDS